MRHLSLFSGIGGIDLAAEWAGFETIAFVEIDKYCQKVLRKHWPNVPIIEDVKDVTKEKIMEYAKCQSRRQETSTRLDIERLVLSETRWDKDTNRITTSGGQITLISGGFPCQPHSVAGKRKGSADERNLWPEFRRVIGEIKPRWVLAENVPGLFSSDSGRFFGEVVRDLAEMGYSVGWATYGAVDVGALHRRNRVFIVGYSKYSGLNAAEVTRSIEPGSNNSAAGKNATSQSQGPSEQSGDVADTSSQRLSWASCRELGEFSQPARPSQGCELSRGDAEKRGIWAVEPNVGRVAHGIPSRVDRLKCLGNAVVPQQVYPMLKAIADIDNQV